MEHVRLQVQEKRVNKQDIKALFMAHGFTEKLQPDGSMDLNPNVYDAAQALLSRWSNIMGHMVGEVVIGPHAGAPARKMLVYRDCAASDELPVFILRHPDQASTAI